MVDYYLRYNQNRNRAESHQTSLFCRSLLFQYHDRLCYSYFLHHLSSSLSHHHCSSCTRSQCSCCPGCYRYNYASQILLCSGTDHHNSPYNGLDTGLQPIMLRYGSYHIRLSLIETFSPEDSRRWFAITQCEMNRHFW